MAAEDRKIRTAREEAVSFSGSIRSPQIVEFLKVLRRQIPIKLLIIWNDLRAHRCHIVRDYAEQHGGDIPLEFLTAYAPELNPTEYIWGYFRHTRSATCAPDTLAKSVTWLAVDCVPCNDGPLWYARSGSKQSWRSELT